MDEAGFVPVPFVCNFPNVICYGAEYNLMLNFLSESKDLELDQVNETIRPKEGWERV